MTSVFCDFQSVELLTSCNSRFFGFETFTADFFKTLHLGFQVYHDSHFKKTGLAPDKMSLRQCFNAIVGFRRRQHDVDFLKKSSSWKIFAISAQHNAALQQQLAETEEQFQREARFTTHTNTSLLDAYEKLMELEKLLQYAKRDLARAKRRWFFGHIPSGIIKLYEDYLAQQESLLDQERSDIVTHMLSRLIQVAYDPLLENSDTLPAVIDELKTKGFLKAKYTAPVLSDDALTKDQFLSFHRILETHEGDVENVKAMLHALPWFKQQASLPQRFKVAHLIPSAKCKPERLFWGANLRYDWFSDFHNQAKIDATLHYLKRERVKGALTFESLSNRMVVIHAAEQSLEQEVRRIKSARQQCTKGWLRWFNKTTLVFLDKLESKLQKQAISLISEKVGLLSFITIAPMEEVQSLKLFDFIKSIEANISALEVIVGQARLVNLRRQLSRQMHAIKKTITSYYQTHLKNYFCLWTDLPHVPSLSEASLAELYEKARAQEALLLGILSSEWAIKIKIMQHLRETHQLRCLENAARLNLIELLGLNPSLVQNSIKKELQAICEALVVFIQTKIKNFDYASQKNILAKMLEKIAQEERLDAENAVQLSDSQRAFLKSFPEVNFYLNVRLRIKQEEKILEKLLNPTEIEERLNALYRFIQKEEERFMPQQKAKFILLFTQSTIVTERQANINQLKRGIL